MNTEERLWDYIDNLCSPEERTAIEQLLKTDASWKQQYEELLAFHQQLHAVELDEPSMGFKHRVMEQVLLSPPPAALKTRVDNRIIYGIAAFFVLTICSVLGYSLSQINWGDSSGFNLPEMKLPAINWSMFSSTGYTLFFLSVNMVLGLFLLDKYIAARRKQHS